MHSPCFPVHIHNHITKLSYLRIDHRQHASQNLGTQRNALPADLNLTGAEAGARGVFLDSSRVERVSTPGRGRGAITLHHSTAPHFIKSLSGTQS